MMDDSEPKRKPPPAIGCDLSAFSLDDLSVYTEALKQEIDRVATERERKSNHMSAAAALFRSPSAD